MMVDRAFGIGFVGQGACQDVYTVYDNILQINLSDNNNSALITVLPEFATQKWFASHVTLSYIIGCS